MLSGSWLSSFWTSSEKKKNTKKRHNEDTPSTPNRPDKRNRTAFDINSYIEYLFSNTPYEFYYGLKAKTYRHLFRLVHIVANSASELGVTDPAVIAKAISYLITHNDSNQLLTDSTYSAARNGYTTIDSYARDLIETLETYAELFLKADTNRLLSPFFAEENQLILVKLAKQVQYFTDMNIDQSYLADYVSMYHFLMRQDLVEGYLDQLECELQRRANINPFDEVGKGRYRRMVNHSHKVLSKYLDEWAEHHGFRFKAKLIYGVDSEAFFSMLSDRAFFKDCAPDVGRNHGAWSHALQWYCIFEHHKRSGFLSHDPLEVYAKMGDLSQDADDLGQLWVRILDLEDKKRYTSPEFVTYNTTEAQTERWPILSKIINRHQYKMTEKYGSSQGYLQHLANKHKTETDDGIVYRQFR